MLRSILGERFNLLEAINTQQVLLLLEQNISCIAAMILDITVQQTVDRDALQSEGYELLHQIPVIVITEDDLPILFDKISNLEKGSHYEMVELRIANTNGRYRWCRIRASALWDENGKLEKVVGIIINIDTEKQAEQVLQDRAERDSLTKLLNKDAGRKRAEAYFQQLGENLHCAMLIIDLDDFKQVNDHYGHLFGDTVLTTAAKEIKYLFRNQDIVSRVGGDEFMVLMRGVSDRTIVENRCKRLLEVFQKMIRSYQLQIPMGCSIGVALAPEHGNNYLQLFKCADQALYQAKKQGKHNYVIYDPAKRGAQYSVTAHKTRIDSDEQPGMADGNIVQYAFRKLYASQDVGEAVRNILAMIGQKMNVSRVYIFENSPDNRFCSNTYEWCNDGIHIHEEIRRTDEANDIVSHRYIDQLEDEESLSALQNDVITVDAELDQRRMDLCSDIFHDILPVRFAGVQIHSGLWDRIAQLRPAENILYDFADEPEFTAKIVRKFVDLTNATIDQCEQLGLLDPGMQYVHCTGAYTNDLPTDGMEDGKAKARNVWSFGMAQILSTVSPAMHEEFEIDIVKPLYERFGLMYYGCCEPLHHKIDMIRKVRNVRKISCSPWCDSDIAAENIAGDYVFSCKSNPAFICGGSFDEENIRKQLATAKEACRRTNTPLEIILKDVSSLMGHPDYLGRWEKIAMEYALG